MGLSARERALVLGGSGFLGSHVADSLTDQGYDVRVFDLTSSPYLKSGQEMMIGSILDLERVLRATKDCQYVYNFAGIADISDAKDRPLETASVNIMGNLNALEAARRANVKRFVFASTVYVYSQAGSFYRASKQGAEHFVETYHSQYGLSYTVLRYGSLYGRRSSRTNGIYQLLEQAIKNQAINYGGTGDAMREYIHVKDAASLSVKILEPEFANRHIIITGNERMSVKSLLCMIAEMVPGKIEIQFNNKPLEAHYEMTPYSFSPKLGYKLISPCHVDIGQGLLDVLEEIYSKQPEARHPEHLIPSDPIEKAPPTLQ